MTRLGRRFSRGTLRREQRGNGAPHWLFSWTDASGERHREALSTDHRVAQMRANEIIRKRDMELAGLSQVEGQSMALSELVDIYLDDLTARAGAKHCANARASLERTLDELHIARVRDLRPLVVLQYRARLVKSGLANRSANLVVDRLSAALTWAVRTEVIAENPIRNVERLPEGPAHQVCKRRALSNDEIARFLAAARADDVANERRVADEAKSGSPRAQRHHGVRVPQAPLWRFLLESAARYGEARALTWGDADLDDDIVTLRAETTKAEKERRIPIRRNFAEELAALREIHKRALGREPGQRDRVFLSPEGKPWCVASNNLMRVHNRLLIAAGIDRVDEHGRKVDIHGLRHTGATRLARSGATLIQTQRILGHSDPKLTAKIYTHLDAEDLRGAVEMAAGERKPRLVSGRDKLDQSA